MTKITCQAVFNCCSIFFALGIITYVHSIHVNQRGGYQDIIVSIDNNVPSITCPQILKNIKALLTESSKVLYKATDGRVYFDRVVIVIPPKWNSLTCGKSLNQRSFTSRSRVRDASIYVTNGHPIFQQYPWTQQSRKCGLPGDFISIGYHYILQFNDTENIIFDNENANTHEDSLWNTHANHKSNPNYHYAYDVHKQQHRNKHAHGSNDFFHLNSIPKERAFVQEWAKYRYGVFPERGFLNDPIYPLSFFQNGERKVSSCLNSHIRVTWSPECDDPSRWLQYQNGTCTFKKDENFVHEYDDATSSIMSFPELKNVHMFCNDSNHDTKSPTKHNFMCDGKSTSQVIYEHPDFQHVFTRDPEAFVPEPEFFIKQVTQPRFVLLVEETGNMNLRDVWKFLKLAVRKFIKYDLPSGTELGMISMNTNDVRVLSNMTSLQSITLRRALADKLPNYPNVDSGGNISLRRGIFQAVEVLRQHGKSASGSVIILVSQGTVSSLDLETSLDLLIREEVTLAAIEYPSLGGDGKIASLAEGTHGPHFAIREKGVGPTTHMSTFIQLINAFMTIQTFFTEDVTSTWPVMVHQAEYKGDSRSYVEANFSFDSSDAQSPAEFFIFTSNPNDPKINSVELISPNGIKYTTQLSDLHDINVVKIDAMINVTGVWRYKIERLADSHQSHFVQVVTKTSREDLNAHLYTSFYDTDKVANLTVAPLALYVEVKYKGNSPVVNADVEAVVSTRNKRWVLKLYDNGNGDPDVTKGDGVYARYFIVPYGLSGTNQLDISARVVVNPYRAKYIVPLENESLKSWKEPCCGSVLYPLDPKRQFKIVHFGERSTNRVTIRVTGIPPKGFYGPSRIGNLQAVLVDSSSRNVTLSWTAPGEDLDEGVPASYEIFYSLDTKNRNWAILAEKKADLEAGVDDNTTITVPYFGSYLLSVRAVDYYGKRSKMSNIARVTVLEPPSESKNTYFPSGTTATGGNTLSVKNSAPPPGDFLTTFDLMLVIAFGVAFVLLLAGIVVIILYCRRVKDRHVAKSTVDNTKISAISDTKSPIHWSASELLGEHDKRQSFYGGSSGGGSPHSSSHTNKDSIMLAASSGSQNTQYQTQHAHQPPMSLNIAPPTDYTGSTRSRGSPDSYDDPDSPTPIPVSVRHMPRPGSRSSHANDYTVCVDTAACYPVPYLSQSGELVSPQGAPYHAQANYPPKLSNVTYPDANRLSSGSSSASTNPFPPPHVRHFGEGQGSHQGSINVKKRNVSMV